MSETTLDIVERFLVFVDADNVPASIMSKALGLIKGRGRIVSCKVFGDFSRTELLPWKNICLSYNLEAIMAWHKSKKNSSDLKICQYCVHSMYNVHSNINKYILITGDGDFTTVIQDLKNREKYVICMGLRMQSSSILQHCCDEFIDLTSDDVASTSSAASKSDIDKRNLKESIIQAVKFELENFPGIDLSQIKRRLLLKNPSYNEQNFGKGSFSKFMQFLGFEVYYIVRDGKTFGPYAKSKSLEKKKNNDDRSERRRVTCQLMKSDLTTEGS